MTGFYLPNYQPEIPYNGEGYEEYGDMQARLHADVAIEASHLSECLSYGDEMIVALGHGEGILKSNFILDIDLDYFRTCQALNPSDASKFYELVRSAYAITIATEPSFVESCRFDDSVAADSSLEILLDHIQKALS